MGKDCCRKFLEGGILKPANGQASEQVSWYVPKPFTSEQALLDNINPSASVAVKFTTSKREETFGIVTSPS
ncbi:unnamed protein product [Ilex paraguariensis]|uniref:Uncharacterized protein n=1 Tax=Ilex paraguariensis TaxID=185542 RepID=A0ABC8TQ91_9AQUA